MFNKLNKKYTALVVIGILTLFFLVFFLDVKITKTVFH